MSVCDTVARRIKRIIVKHLEQCPAQNQCYIHVYDTNYMPEKGYALGTVGRHTTAVHPNLKS